MLGNYEDALIVLNGVRVGEFFDILRKLNVGVADWPLILLETGYAPSAFLWIHALHPVRSIFLIILT